jgi:hypothetical protein
MAAIQDAVKKLAPILLILTIPLLAVEASSGEVVGPPPEVRIYYDRTQPANLLHPYTLRLLAVEVPEGVRECWETLPNGTIVMVCKPLRNALVRVWYEEMKEIREARTGSDGIASVEFRLWTLKATFRVEVYSEAGSVEHRINVNVSPWLTITYVCFAGLVSSLVFSVRRGLW